MHAAALADALAGSRRPDGAISVQELQAWLSRNGLEELARAVAALGRRGRLRAQEETLDPEDHPWF